jgi:hypothetical protein
MAVLEEEGCLSEEMGALVRQLDDLLREE